MLALCNSLGIPLAVTNSNAAYRRHDLLHSNTAEFRMSSARETQFSHSMGDNVLQNPIEICADIRDSLIR